MQHLAKLTSRLTFVRVVVIWLFLYIILFIINSLTFRSWLMDDIIQSLLGIFLLLIPVYPQRLSWYYSRQGCRRIIRIGATLEIIESFLIRSGF